jgi:biopolymer transport protein ExbB
MLFRTQAAVAAILIAGLAAPAAAQNRKSGARLEEAYKREFAYLEAEKRALEQRLAEEKKSAAQRIGAARGEIDALQGRVVGAAGEAHRLEEALLAADREFESLDQSGDVVSDILSRADAAYDRLGLALPEADVEQREQLLAQLDFIFGQAPQALAGRSVVRTETGAYFDEDGQKVEGPILRVGDVASYGLVDGARGVLAPAGVDRLKLWPADGGAEAAAALAAGTAPEALPMFLYETLEKGIERRKDKTPIEVIEAGGIIGWVIVGLGSVTLLMILIRALLLLRASMGTRKLLPPILRHIQRGETDKAIALARRSRTSAGRVLTATLENLGRGREQLEDIVAESVLQEQPHLSRFGSAILVAAAVSPLLGLLGTVTGMISTFDVITEFGTGNPKLLSGGISEALITTELGLIVAIPALLLGHLLSGWSERIRDSLDAAALAAVNRAAGVSPPTDEPTDSEDLVPAAEPA